VAEELKLSLSGKVAIVTGANTGIGLETARTLAELDATVILACRDEEKAQDAIKDIKQSTSNGKLEFQKLDLNSLTSVREFASNFKASNRPLHLLILNAGIMGCPYGVTEDGYETQIGVNHLAHFLLTNLLLDSLKEGAPSRVVLVSSFAHNFARRSGICLQDFEHHGADGNYWSFWSYGRSKLANIIFANEFSRRYLKDGITAHSLHPGSVATNLGRYLFPSYSKFIMEKISKFFSIFKTPQQGAATSIFVALAPELEGIPAKYYSDCQEVEPAEISKDLDTMKRLWEKSEELTEIFSTNP